MGRKYQTFKVTILIPGKDEEIEKCYYCNTERKAKEHAEKEFGRSIKILYVEEVLV